MVQVWDSNKIVGYNDRVAHTRTTYAVYHILSQRNNTGKLGLVLRLASNATP